MSGESEEERVLRAVLVDPRSRRTVLIPMVGDLHRLASTRVGEGHVWSICQGEEEGQPGLLLCSRGEAAGEDGQRYFRLLRCTTTFAGPCLFIGHVSSRTTEVPEWFWNEVTSKVIWLPEDTRLLWWEKVRSPVTCPETGRKTEELISRPVYGRRP